MLWSKAEDGGGEKMDENGETADGWAGYHQQKAAEREE